MFKTVNEFLLYEKGLFSSETVLFHFKRIGRAILFLPATLRIVLPQS